MTKAEIAKVRKEFSGAVTEMGANRTLCAKDDYNKGWNDGITLAMNVMNRYVDGAGLFQVVDPPKKA